MRISIDQKSGFPARHIGPNKDDLTVMLKRIGINSLDSLIDQTIPASIRLKEPLNLPSAKTEHRFLKDLRTLASQNMVYTSYIGMGYNDTLTPAVIQRNILENPGWYTAYTPYQAEIAQGRLEMLVNFQTMIIDLTGMELANASLLDEATAAAEAMSMMHALRRGTKKDADVFFVSDWCHPQTIEVLKTRAEPIGIRIETGDHNQLDKSRDDLFGVLVQYPASDGAIQDYSGFIEELHENGCLAAVAADLLSLLLLKPPGEMGADVVVGSSQRFGIPMGYGGPHAAYFATRESFKRQVPGRIIGVTIDANGNTAYRMALQTREQHIRREKATSNICTAQVLLAVMAAAYAIYHGPDGLRNIAERVHGLTRVVADKLSELGLSPVHAYFFDTLKFKTTGFTEKIRSEALKRHINLRFYEDDYVGISMDEAKDRDDIRDLLEVFAAATGKQVTLDDLDHNIDINWPESLLRHSPYLTHETFRKYHSEHEMLRYLKRLENKDISLVHSMIPLGSCTMKLNATTEMIPVTWPEFANLHPFAPLNQAKGYHRLFMDLKNWLSAITGFDSVSLQPNSGAQGEFTGLMVIRAYHRNRGENQRNVALIPSSAHGTNPASAVMAGMEVVVVQCDEYGNIDVDDLEQKAGKYADRLSALMVTYPSTHGVFEPDIRKVCDIVHQNGGLVYMDGANMNAQVGLTTPAQIGADVCHLNLHKTFCIPHGGGGPGMGPIAAAKHLTPFLPQHPVLHDDRSGIGIKPVSAAPWGSAGILVISYAYIALMGSSGLTDASKYAILNTNYILSRLKEFYPVLYTGVQGYCAHEMIIDLRPVKQSSGIDVADVAKRLMDFGFHAPTVSFPVPGTIMIEPTESESLDELDRFCDAMIAIRREIQEIEDGLADAENNVLHNAPHTASAIASDKWDHPYSREKAAYPLPWVRDAKFWTSVSRVDEAYGDRNLLCTCPPLENYQNRENEMETSR